MFKVRKINKKDYDQIIDIKKQLELTDDYLNHKDIVSMVMIEEGNYIGFVSYREVNDMTLVIDKLYSTQIFTDNNYKDLLFRSILNYGLMNGKIYANVLAKKNENFYETYDFEKISEPKVKELNNLLNSNYTLGYQINITEFFNQPCDA